MPETLVLELVTASVRTGDHRSLLQGLRDVLAGLDVAPGGGPDPRDLLVVLAPYAHAALVLRRPSLLAEAADAAPEPLRTTVREAAAWTDVDPAAWGFAVVETPEGVRYQREQQTREEVAAMVARLTDRLGVAGRHHAEPRPARKAP